MEAAVDPDTISKSIKMVWEAFSAEPIPFLAGLALVGMVILLFTRSFYRQQIVTLTARRELAHDQAQAAQEAQKGLETEIGRLQAEIGGLKEAVERDAAQRDQEVSADVKVATTATENAMERLKEKESDFTATVRDLVAAHRVVWDDDFILRDDDVIKADDLKKFGTKDKDED